MQKNTQTGFTLVELMIVIAVVGVLAAIAYPSYQDSLRKSRRADAKAALSELSVFMERWYTAKGCYTDTCPTTGTSSTPPALPFNISPKSLYNPNVTSSTIKAANYDLSVCVPGMTAAPCNTVTVPTAGFTLVAVPRSTRPDADCGSLTLDSTGVKGAVVGTTTKTGEAAAACW